MSSPKLAPVGRRRHILVHLRCGPSIRDALGAGAGVGEDDVAKLLRSSGMVQIAQRELRNDVSAVLRRAEQGERFTITVGGRPVAELGPLASTRKPGAPDRLAAVLAETPIDTAWAVELRELRDADAATTRDPWAA